MYIEDSQAILEGVLFDGNRGGDVGGNGGGLASIESSVVIRNSMFSNNATDGLRGGGGAIYQSGGVLDISKSVFRNNETTFLPSSGGAIYIAAGTARIYNSEFYDHESVSGGALFVGGEVVIANSVFANGYALEGGAVLVAETGECHIVNSTFVGNLSVDVGAGIYAMGGTGATAVANSIFWENRSDMTGLRDDVAGLVNVTYSNLLGGTSTNIDADPMFVALGHRETVEGNTWGKTRWLNHDFRLRPDSPCIDAGSNAALPADVFDLDGDGDTAEPIPIDLAGNPRRIDDPATPDTGFGTAPIVDMGAYEYQPTSYILDIELLATTTLTPGDTLASLPAGKDDPLQVNVGQDYFIEVWVRNVSGNQLGISGGFIDLSFTPGLAVATGLGHGSIFAFLTGGQIDNTAGYVDDLGGLTFDTDKGDDEWVWLGWAKISAGAGGTATFTVLPGDPEFALAGAGQNVPWGAISMDAVEVVQTPGLVDVYLAVVESPSVLDTRVVLPAHVDQVVEGHHFWAEVWVRSGPVFPTGVASGSVAISYLPAYTTAVAVEHGGVFTAGASHVIDNVAGRVTFGGSTLLTDKGDDEYVLLGRVKFIGDAPVDLINKVWGPYDIDLGIEAGEAGFSLVGVGPAPSDVRAAAAAEVLAVVFDVNDSGRVDVADFSLFAPAFPLFVGGTEPPYTTWADFNQSGRVDVADFSMFAPVFGKYIREITKDQLPASSGVKTSSLMTGQTFQATNGDVGGGILSSALPEQVAPADQRVAADTASHMLTINIGEPAAGSVQQLRARLAGLTARRLAAPLRNRPNTLDKQAASSLSPITQDGPETIGSTQAGRVRIGRDMLQCRINHILQKILS